MPRQLKPYHCVMCNDEDPLNFGCRKCLCRKCTKKRDYSTHKRIIQPFLCKTCGVSGEENFYKNFKGVCKTCHSARQRYKSKFTPKTEVKINIIKKEST